MVRPSARAIAEQNRYMAQRQRQFRVAADALSTAFEARPEVERIVLIGSVARPLQKEVPRFSDFRRAAVAVWHECKDLDLAVWLGRLDQLDALRRLGVPKFLMLLDPEILASVRSVTRFDRSTMFRRRAAELPEAEAVSS